MNVLIVEPSQWGHRLNIASLIIEAVSRVSGCRTFFATSPTALTSEQYQTWVQPKVEAAAAFVDDSLKDMPDNSGWRAFRDQIPEIRRIVQQHKIDHVLVPSGDGLVQVAFATRWFNSIRAGKGVEYEAMMLRGRFAYEPCDTLKRKLARASWFASVRHSPFHRIHHMDPMIHQAALRRSPGLSSRLKSIPDPVDPIEADLTHVQARRKMGLPEEGRIAGCVGVLDVRKGMDLFLRAYAKSIETGRLSAKTDRLLLVGKQDNVVAKLLSNEMKPLVASGSIVAIPRFVSDVEMSNAISAMNLVVTPYPLHIGSASIVIRAAAQRRPVLASNFGWLGQIVPQFKLGTVCDVMNQAAFADAFATSMNQTDDYVQSDEARRFVEFCAVSNFQSHWVGRICERLGQPSPPIVTWASLNANQFVSATAAKAG